MQPAARVSDRFGHAPTQAGVVGGVSVAAGQGGVAGLTSAVLATMMAGPDTGMLVTGSANVFINSLLATMVERATGMCSQHGGTPRLVATGSGSVFINDRPAARVTSQMDCTAMIRRGSPNVFIGGPSVLLGGGQTPICAALLSDRAALERFRVDAQAASAAYDPPATRRAPDGYRNATPEDLRRLRLTEAMLEHPVNQETKKETEFRAAVFINEQTGAPLVAYKGTTVNSREDWLENYKQGRGQDSFYYNQAQRIAQRTAQSPYGADAHFAGHSLGGGMASAASRATGKPATTFNAAGLHAKTVPHPNNSEIDAMYVEGEALRNSQSYVGPPTAATRTWPLQPADQASQPPPAGGFQGWKDSLVRSANLHGMDSVHPAIAAKRNEIEAAANANGCL